MERNVFSCMRYMPMLLFVCLSLLAFTGISAHASATLVANGEFETISSTASTTPEAWSRGRWGVNSAVFSYPVASNDGSKAAAVELTSRGSGDAKWAFSPVAITGGNTYQYADSYTANVSSYVTAQFTLSDGSLTYTDIASPAASASWQNESLMFTAPANAVAVSVFHLVNQVGKLTIDHVSLTDVTPPPPPPDNPIKNPSLESPGSGGKPLYWGEGRWGVNTAVFTYPVPGEDGASAARTALTSYTSGDAKWYFDPVSVSPGATYQFSDYEKSDVTSYVYVEFHHTDGTLTYLNTGAAAASSAWTRVTRTFSVPAGVTSLSVFHVIKSVGTLDVDNYSLSPVSSDPSKFDQGYVSINFDDGWLSAYQNALPILDRAGFTADTFIITGYVNGGFSSYVTWDDVKSMQARGYEVGAHTRTHPDLTTLSAAEARDEIAGSRQDLFDQGIRPVDFFAYPFGAYNGSIQQIVKDIGFFAARSSDGGYNAKNDTDLFALRRQPMEDSTTFADVKSYIDTAMANKTWVILLFHEVNDSGDQYAVTPALFQRIVEYLASKNIRPITLSEGLTLYNR